VLKSHLKAMLLVVAMKAYRLRAAIVRPPTRRLQCRHPSVQERFLRHLRPGLQHIHFAQRVATLHREVHLQEDDLQREYDQLTDQHMLMCREADRRCRKLRMGAVPYSPELTKKIHEIKLWRKMVNKLMGKKHSTRYIVSLARKVEVNLDPSQPWQM